MGRTGVRMTFSSLPEARMLVSFFSLVGFTSMSFSRLCSPQISPSYTGSPGTQNISPRGSRLNSAYATALPARSDTSEPVNRVGKSPRYGSYPSRYEFMMPVPLVSVRNSSR